MKDQMKEYKTSQFDNSERLLHEWDMPSSDPEGARELQKELQQIESTDKLSGLTAERCEELWKTKKAFGEMHPTPEEDAEVKAVWKTMGGENRWIDAFFKIWREKKNERI